MPRQLDSIDLATQADMMVLTIETGKTTVFDNEYEERKVSSILTNDDAVNIGNTFLYMGDALPGQTPVSHSMPCVLTIRAHYGRRTPPPNWLSPRARAAGSRLRTPAPREVPA